MAFIIIFWTLAIMSFIFRQSIQSYEKMVTRLDIYTVMPFIIQDIKERLFKEKAVNGQSRCGKQISYSWVAVPTANGLNSPGIVDEFSGELKRGNFNLHLFNVKLTIRSNRLSSQHPINLHFQYKELVWNRVN